MVAVIRRVEDVRVVQLSECDQLAKDPLHGFIHTLQRLKPFRHEQVGEAMMDRFHLAEPAEDPLLIGIGSKVIAGRPVSRHVEEEVSILRSRVFRAVG